MCTSIETCCRSTGRIWLSDLDCSEGDEVIEDCSHRGWGRIGHCSHYDDVGVICRPNSMYNSKDMNPRPDTNRNNFFGTSCTCTLGLPAVKNLTVTAVAHTSITVSWIVSSRLLYQLIYYC